MGSISGYGAAHGRMDSGIGMSETSSAMGMRAGSETFGSSGIKLPSFGSEKMPERGVKNPFLMDNSSVDAITPTDPAGGCSRPVRNRLLDDTAQPPSYDEAAAESTSRRFGGRLLSGGLFGRDRDRDRNHRGTGNGGEGRESWNEKNEAYDAMNSRYGQDHDDGDEESGTGAKKGWWKSKGKGIRGRFSLGLN